MREIKFRGKRIDNGEWVYGNLIYDNISDKYWIDLSINESEKIDGGLHIYAVEVIPETIGQYTGLHDKNGKEIYEGDIFDVLNSHEERFMVWVEYNEKYAEYVIRGNSIIVDNEPLGDINAENTVILLGNITDNPELVEV